jgi:hypothetical protein
MWRGSNRFSLSDPSLSSDGAQVALPYLYYGSRRAQPARVRKFIEFAVERLSGNMDFVLTDRELVSKP